MAKPMQKPAPPRSADMSLDVDDFTLDLDDITLADDGIALGGDAPDEPGNLADVDIEKVAEDEISEVLAGFKQRAKNEDARKEGAIDSEFWFCLYFQTREQKDEFLAKIGWDDIGDKYIDGMEAAEAVGITLESFIPPMPQIRIDQKLAALAQRITTALPGKKKKRIVIVDDD